MHSGAAPTIRTPLTAPDRRPPDSWNIAPATRISATACATTTDNNSAESIEPVSRPMGTNS